MGGVKTVVGILTGGKSKRMGRDKASVPIGGRTMVERVAEAAAAAGIEAVVLGPDDADTGLTSLADDPGLPPGPLAGLITALRARPDTNVILVATDQPMVTPSTLRHLADAPVADIVVAIDDDIPQVTCARYGPAVLDEFERRRGTDDPVWRLRALLDDLDVVRVLPETWRSWGEDGRSFLSLDRPDDVEAAERRFGASGTGV